jgi:hypothetical protein
MKRVLAVLTTSFLLVACGSGEDSDDEQADPSPSAPTTTETPRPEPTTEVPAGEGAGDVDLRVADEPLPGDDWSASCRDTGDGLSFTGTATPLSTVQLDLTADGTVRSLVVSGEGFGPFSADEAGAAGLEVETTATGFTLSGEIEGAGAVSGELGCPA